MYYGKCGNSKSRHLKKSGTMETKRDAYVWKISGYAPAATRNAGNPTSMLEFVSVNA